MCACVRVSNTRRKQTTLKLVHSGTIENLKAHLNSFEKAADGDAASTATSAVTRLREIEQAPPCSSYKKLLSLREMEVWHNKFESTGNKDELTEVKMDWAEIKKPVLDLICACKSALGEVKQAKKDAAKMEGPKARGKGKTSREHDLFKFAASSEDSASIPVVDEGAAASQVPQQFNASKPMIIKLRTESAVSELKVKMLDEDVMQQSTTFIQNIFDARNNGNVLPPEK